MRCEICGEGTWSDGLPDWYCWDATALPDEIDTWVRRVEADHNDPAGQFLGSIGSSRAADALRRHLNTEDSFVLRRVVASLGWSGDQTDGPALIALLERDDPNLPMEAAQALADLEIQSAAAPIARMLDDPDLSAKQRGQLLSRLAWLNYREILPELRERLRTDGMLAQLGELSLVQALVRLGGPEDRAELARLAIEQLESCAAGSVPETGFDCIRPWLVYVHNVKAVAPEEVTAVEAGLSDAGRNTLTTHPWLRRISDDDAAPLGPLTVPRRSIAGFTDIRPLGDGAPPGKFGGQPDWRERPAWPIGGDGRPLMFYGQLPIDDETTAYLFTAGPDEWQPLGPGSALVVQPGGACHLPTVELEHGPQSYAWAWDEHRLVRRARGLPRPERFVVWEAGNDPETFPTADIAEVHWNKVGGSPIWLQNDDTPPGSWRFAFQFGADGCGGERADGAVFYGWVNDAGEGALGWQCH